MILALFTVGVDHHATTGASLKKKRKHAGNLKISFTKLTGKVPTKQKCFEISCFGYKICFIECGFSRRRKREGISDIVTCANLQFSAQSCGMGCWCPRPALIWKEPDLLRLLLVG